MERIVCISGGTSGIGAGLVVAFLQAGDRVYTFGRTPAKVEALCQAHAQAVAAGRLRALVGDATDGSFRKALHHQIAHESGHLDVLVNNAAVIVSQGTLEESLDDWHRTLEIDLIAPFALIQVMIDLLERSSSPAVINLSSACAHHPFSTCTSTCYSVAKAGLEMLTRRLALALGPKGIRVNAVAPGVVPSPMWGEASELIEQTIARRHVLKQQPVTAGDIAAAVLYLAAAERVTGAILAVDAGYTLG
ncbi:SDR family oxidoreductase [Caldichromatium japonicum]|uniref:SDR family oxidoreductase n=1 Tax=Caldichromatium japonicum TaxID=2699430 RepID=A0A6G7VCV0_9GAMM|nr:SDR family oxidoreductase [Caldichromatium japonicum]QIK37730.1 SDR family oxidoreductase [Caldichromatium japonicum]